VLAAMKARLLDSIAHDPDAVEAREQGWMRLHRLQTAYGTSAAA
jgi:hypothetical protein